MPAVGIALYIYVCINITGSIPLGIGIIVNYWELVKVPRGQTNSTAHHVPMGVRVGQVVIRKA